MKILISLFLCVLLAACATTKSPYKNPKIYVGTNIQTVATKWGMPDQTLHARNGVSYYVYNNYAGSNFFTSTAASTHSVYPRLGITAQAPTQANQGLLCTTIFQTDSTGKITYVNTKGTCPA